MRSFRCVFMFVLAFVCHAVHHDSERRNEDSGKDDEAPGWWTASSLMANTARNVRAAVSAVGDRMMRAEGHVKQSYKSHGRRVNAHGHGDDAFDANPVDCKLSDWNEWTVCQYTCGKGNQLRHRWVTQPGANGGEACDDNKQEERPCNAGDCPVDCKWFDWSDWSACNVTCGWGSAVSSRNPHRAQFGGSPCVGETDRYQECRRSACVVDCEFNDWGEWYPCSLTCGGGRRMRTRQVVQEKNELGRACKGNTLDTGNCSMDQCPIDCEVADWGFWSQCDRSCGGGTTWRNRAVVTPFAHGGVTCGNLTESKGCSTMECPADCEMNDWNEWLPCSVTCGKGNTKRYRTFASMGNDLGDKCKGEQVQESNCSMNVCPVDCEMSDWTKWTACSVTCGSGQSDRTREIVQVAQNGGRECKDSNYTADSKYCSLEHCPVDCVWSDWNDWIACPVTCGQSTSYRLRLVETHEELGGQECQGGEKQDRICSEKSCPKHCEFKDWEDWTVCDVTCGDGKGSRTRGRIAAEYGGEDCRGHDSEEGLCQPGPCPVDCAWNDWTDWECQVTCGSGPSRRHRGIKHPAELGGNPCAGADFDMANCHLEDTKNLSCPIDCQWSDWSDWGVCSMSCGMEGMSKRNREILVQAKFGGQTCFGSQDDAQKCERTHCPVDCVWANWGTWSGCPATCGTGYRTRERKVKSSATDGGAPCVNGTDYKACATHPCPVDCLWDVWSEWRPCSKSCGLGQSTRNRTAKVSAAHGGRICEGDPKEEDTCNAQACPIDCQWSAWSDWNPCSTSCNGGERLQRRTMEIEQYGGHACDGNDTKPETCNEQDCPVDCAWSEWAKWSECSKTCGGGSIERLRLKSPVEQDGGRPCEGQSTQEHECNTEGCPRDCEWGPWSRWTPCSKKCNLGLSKRFRDVIISVQHSGVPCAGKDEESISCNPQACSQDCEWADWSEWSDCSDTCGGGTRYMNRTQKREQRSGGLACDGENRSVESCNPNACPVDCEYSDWADWSICSTSCYTGIRMRTRTRTEERDGGRPCKADLMEEGQCTNAPSALLCPAPSSSSTQTTTVVVISGPPDINLNRPLSPDTILPDLPNYSHEDAHAATFNVVHYKQTEWDPEIDHGKHWSIPSHADISRSWDSKYWNGWHAGEHAWGHHDVSQGRGGAGDAEPCTRDELQATMDVYEASQLRIDAIVDAWTQDGKDVIAKVRGNLTVYVSDADKFRSDSSMHVAMIKAIAKIAKVDEKNIELKMITSPELDALEDWQKRVRGNAILNFRINALRDIDPDEDAITNAIKSQSSKQVTWLLQRQLGNIKESVDIYATGLKFAIGHRDHVRSDGRAK